MKDKIVTKAVKTALIKAHLAGKTFLDLNSLLERYHNLHEPFVYTLKRDPEAFGKKSTEEIKSDYEETQNS